MTASNSFQHSVLSCEEEVAERGEELGRLENRAIYIYQCGSSGAMREELTWLHLAVIVIPIAGALVLYSLCFALPAERMRANEFVRRKSLWFPVIQSFYSLVTSPDILSEALQSQVRSVYSLIRSPTAYPAPPKRLPVADYFTSAKGKSASQEYVFLRVRDQALDELVALERLAKERDAKRPDSVQLTKATTETHREWITRLQRVMRGRSFVLESEEVMPKTHWNQFAHMVDDLLYSDRPWSRARRDAFRRKIRAITGAIEHLPAQSASEHRRPTRADDSLVAGAAALRHVTQTPVSAGGRDEEETPETTVAAAAEQHSRQGLRPIVVSPSDAPTAGNPVDAAATSSGLDSGAFVPPTAAAGGLRSIQEVQGKASLGERDEESDTSAQNQFVFSSDDDDGEMSP